MKGWALLLVGIVIGALTVAAASKFSKPKTLAECLIANMKGMPGPMFATVHDYCRDDLKVEMTDKDVGIDDWQPAGKIGPNDKLVK